MGKLICPICGTSTAFSPVYLKQRAILNEESSSDRTIYGEATMQAVIPRDYIGALYAILDCQACEERFVARYIDYEWVAVYPLPHKQVSDKIPEPIKGEFEEANLCFAVGAYRACVAVCQIALEALWRDKKVSGLNQLKDDGIISSALFERATEIRLWAGIIKHKTLAESVSKDDAEQLLTYLEVILNDVYVEPKRLESFKQRREQINRSKSD